MPSVLFVCTANRFRSPFACALFRQMVAGRADARAWRIESAGTWAKPGQPTPPLAQAVAHDLGIDLSNHRSRCINRDLLHLFGLVLTMEQGHKEALRVEFPSYAGRVFLLSEMAGMHTSISDPVRGTLSEYRHAAREIQEWVRLGYERIIPLAQELATTFTVVQRNV